MSLHEDKLKYAIVDAAGNVILHVDVGTRAPGAFGGFVLPMVRRCATKVDLICFVGHVAGVYHLSFWNPDGTHERMCGNACRSLPLAIKTWHGDERLGAGVAIVTEFCHALTRYDADGNSSVEFSAGAIGISSHPRTQDLLIDVGTPHIVRQVDDLHADIVNVDGPRLSTGDDPVNATF